MEREAAMSEPKLTIESLTARAVVVPLARPLRTASGEIPAAPLLLLDLATAQGVTGRAYLFAYTRVTLRAVKTLLEDLAPLLAGKPVAPQDCAAEFERTFRLLGRQGLLGMALSGIDMALWDALGRALDRPVAALWAARRARSRPMIPSASSTSATMRGASSARWRRAIAPSRSRSAAAISSRTSRRCARCAASSASRFG
jgi:L-alanine-DL-glutamate epimerase-like enolase superfamily enzyme